MLNKILKSVLISLVTIFSLTLNSCKKPADTIAIITIIDINGNTVEGARVTLHQDGQISQTGQYSEIFNEKFTDSSGKTEHTFEHEAILNIDVSKWEGTNELTGTNVVRLLKNKTVEKTIEID